MEASQHKKPIARQRTESKRRIHDNKQEDSLANYIDGKYIMIPIFLIIIGLGAYLALREPSSKKETTEKSVASKSSSNEDDWTDFWEIPVPSQKSLKLPDHTRFRFKVKNEGDSILFVHKRTGRQYLLVNKKFVGATPNDFTNFWIIPIGGPQTLCVKKKIHYAKN